MEKQISVITIVLILILLVGGVFLYFYYHREVLGSSYNGFSVTMIEDSKYQIQIKFKGDPNMYNIYSVYHPKYLEKVETPSKEELLSKVITNKDQVYFTTSSQSSSISVMAALEISKFIANKYFFNIPTHGALTGVNNANLPIITCENITDKTSVVFLKTGSETKAYFENNCLIIQGETESNLVEVADAVALRMIGVLK